LPRRDLLSTNIDEQSGKCANRLSLTIHTEEDMKFTNKAEPIEAMNVLMGEMLQREAGPDGDLSSHTECRIPPLDKTEAQSSSMALVKMYFVLSSGVV
jgi:hypothetical protein